MKKTLAVAVAALALFGALAGCGPRDRNAGGGTTGDKGGVSQPGSVRPTTPAAPATPDVSGVDADLDAIDGVLASADSDLAAADKAPEDAD